jgi:hypothetical protein
VHIFKISALLQNPVEEAHRNFSQNIRELQCAGNDHVFRMVRGRYKFRYSTSVIAVIVQKAPARSTVFKCVWNVKCGKDCTVSVIATPLNNGSVKANASSEGDGSDV